MTQISILGCGWLGLPLAQAFLQKKVSVKGSTTTKANLEKLEKQGIEPFLISLDSKNISGNITDFLTESRILIVAIPPKLRGNSTENFVEKIENLIPYIEKSSIENLIFISSTSVYNDLQGTVLETTPLKPDSEGGRQLAIVEALLQSNTQFKTSVIRFAGLIGEDRNPVKFLSGRENIENPEAPINLIHQADCIGIILKLIEKNCWNETFNAAAPFHPSREKYYTKKAAEMGLPLPKFNLSGVSNGKTVLSNKVEKDLEYVFIKPHL